MDHTRFDQLVRAFAKPLNRRGVIGIAGGFLALATRPTQATQLPATCAQTGQVCTMLYGCCSGLTCATSSINPSYGVCVPGDGGMVTTGTSLVVPFDSSDTSQAQIVTDSVTDTTSTTTATTTTTQEDRKARIQARKAEVKSRRSSRKSEQQTRQDSQQDRRQDRKADADTANGPNLEFVIRFPGAMDEYLQVRNVDDVNSVLLGISTILAPNLDTGIGEQQQGVTLSPGETFRFIVSALGDGSAKLTDTTYAWTGAPVCGSREDGFLLRAGFSATGATTEYTIPCSQTGSVTLGTSNSGNGRKRRRKNQNSRGKQKSRGKGK